MYTVGRVAVGRGVGPGRGAEDAAVRTRGREGRALRHDRGRIHQRSVDAQERARHVRAEGRGHHGAQGARGREPDH